MNSTLKKMTAWLCAAAMLVNGAPLVSAEPLTPQVLTAASDFPTDLARLSIPETLGAIEEAFLTGGNRTVILIQDAHAVPQAQNSIQKLIAYFQKEYGAGAVAVEGASGPLDTFLLRRFPDKDLLKRTMRAYHDRAELSGASAAALFDPGLHHYQGVEDWSLYEEGIRLYQQAARQEAPVLEQLDTKQADLDQRKQKIYSAALLAFDKMLQSTRDEESHLAETLKAANRILKAPEGSALEALILQVNAADASEEHLRWAASQSLLSVRKYLKDGHRSIPAALNAAIQSFETSQMSAAEFALILKRVSREEKIPVSFESELARQVRMQNRLHQIKGTKLYRDLQDYLHKAKETLMTTPEQKQLNQESLELDLLRRLNRLELTCEDWEALKKSQSARDTAQSLNPDAVAFYRNSEEREGAFLKKINELFDKPRTPVTFDEKSTRRQDFQSTVIFVAGGFHSHGMARRLREENIRYLLLTPKIKELPAESVYRQQMMGNVSWKKYFRAIDGRVSLRDAFLSAVRDELLSDKSRDASNKKINFSFDLHLLKLWRDDIIRGLADEHRLQDAAQYTRFLDELALSRSTIHDAPSTLLARLTRFIDGLKQLESTQQLTEENLLQLLTDNARALTHPSWTQPDVGPIRTNTAQVPAIGGQFSGEALLRGDLLGLPVRDLGTSLRSEVRIAAHGDLVRALPDLKRVLDDIENRFSPASLLTSDPFAASNESGWPEALAKLDQWPRESGDRIHMGLSGFANYEIAAARKSSVMILFDINPRALRVHELARSILNDPAVLTGEDFKERFLSAGHRLYFTQHKRTWGLKDMLWVKDPEKFAHIKKLFTDDRVFTVRMDLRDEGSVNKLTAWLQANKLSLDSLYVSNAFSWSAWLKDSPRLVEEYKRQIISLTGAQEFGKTLILDSSLPSQEGQKSLTVQVIPAAEHPLLDLSQQLPSGRSEVRMAPKDTAAVISETRNHETEKLLKNLRDQLFNGAVTFQAATPIKAFFWDEDDEEYIGTYRDAFVARQVVRDYFEIINAKESFYLAMGNLAHELVTNILDHGNHGELEVREIHEGDQTYYDFTSIDHGPGIVNPNILSRESAEKGARGHGFRVLNNTPHVAAMTIDSQGKKWIRNSQKKFDLEGSSDVVDGTRFYIRVRYPGAQRSEVRATQEGALNKGVSKAWWSKAVFALTGEGSYPWTYSQKVRFPLSFKERFGIAQRLAQLKTKTQQLYPEHPRQYGFETLLQEADTLDTLKDYLSAAESLMKIYHASPRLMLESGLPLIRTLTLRTSELPPSEQPDIPVSLLLGDSGAEDEDVVIHRALQVRLNTMVLAFGRLAEALERTEASGLTNWRPQQFQFTRVEAHAEDMTQFHELGEWADAELTETQAPLVTGRVGDFLRYALIFKTVRGNEFGVTVKPDGTVVLDEIAADESREAIQDLQRRKMRSEVRSNAEKLRLKDPGIADLVRTELAPLIPAKGHVLEIGTGLNGALTRILAEAKKGKGVAFVATDVDAEAAQSATEQLSDLKSVDVRVGDLFAPVQGEKFDTIFWNPPWYSEERPGKRNGLAYLDRDYSALKRYLQEAPRYLTEDGSFFVIIPRELSEVLWENAPEHGLSLEEISSRKTRRFNVALFSLKPMTAEQRSETVRSEVRTAEQVSEAYRREVVYPAILDPRIEKAESKPFLGSEITRELRAFGDIVFSPELAGSFAQENFDQMEQNRNGSTRVSLPLDSKPGAWLHMTTVPARADRTSGYQIFRVAPSVKAKGAIVGYSSFDAAGTNASMGFRIFKPYRGTSYVSEVFYKAAGRLAAQSGKRTLVVHEASQINNPEEAPVEKMTAFYLRRGFLPEGLHEIADRYLARMIAEGYQLTEVDAQKILGHAGRSYTSQWEMHLPARSEMRSETPPSVYDLFERARVRLLDWETTQHGLHVGTQKVHFNEVVSAFPASTAPPFTVFDAGSGQGIFAFQLALARANAHVIGVESDARLWGSSQKVLAKALEDKAVGPTQLEFIQDDFNSAASREKMGQADYVYYYEAGTKKTKALADTLGQSMRPGTRLVILSSASGSVFADDLLETGLFTEERVPGAIWTHVLKRTDKPARSEVSSVPSDSGNSQFTPKPTRSETRQVSQAEIRLSGTRQPARAEMRTHAVSELDFAPQYRQIIAGFRQAGVSEDAIQRMESVIVEILAHQPPFVLRQGKPLLNFFRIFDPSLDGRVTKFVSTSGSVYALLSEAFSKKGKDFYDHDNLTALYFASQIAAQTTPTGEPRYDLLSVGHKIKSEEAGGAVPDAMVYDRELEIYLIAEFRAGHGNLSKLLRQKNRQTLNYLRLLLNADLEAPVAGEGTILPQHLVGKNPAGFMWAVDQSVAQGEGWSVESEARNRVQGLIDEARGELERDHVPIRNDFNPDDLRIEFLDQRTLYHDDGTPPEVANALALNPADWAKVSQVLDSLYDTQGFSGFSGIMNTDLYGLAKKLNWQRADGSELSLEEIYYRYFALGATLEDRLAAIAKLTGTSRSEVRAVRWDWPAVTLDHVDDDFDRWVETGGIAAGDLDLLKQILSGDDALLQELLKKYPEKIYIKAEDKKRPERDGRTVYLELERFFPSAAGEIQTLRIKGARPRLQNKSATDLDSHGGGGLVKEPIGVDGQGNIQAKPLGFFKGFGPEGPKFRHEVMTPQGALLQDHALREYDMMRAGTQGKGFEADYPLAAGLWKGLNHAGRSVGFVIAGLRQPDQRLVLYKPLQAQMIKTGDRFGLNPAQGAEVYRRFGQALRAYHDQGYFHRYPHAENIGVDLQGEHVLRVILRDLDTTVTRAELKGKDLRRVETARRFLDIQRMVSDLSLEGRDMPKGLLRPDALQLVHAFLEGYFNGLGEAQLGSVIAQAVSGDFPGLLMGLRMSNEKLKLNADMPQMGLIWKALYELSPSDAPKRSETRRVFQAKTRTDTDVSVPQNSPKLDVLEKGLSGTRQPARAEIRSQAREEAINAFWQDFADGKIPVKNAAAEAKRRLTVYGLDEVAVIDMDRPTLRALREDNGFELRENVLLSGVFSPTEPVLRRSSSYYPKDLVFIAMENVVQHSKTGGVVLSFALDDKQSKVVILSDGEPMNFAAWKANPAYAGTGDRHSALRDHVEPSQIAAGRSSFYMRSGGFQYDFMGGQPQPVPTPATGAMTIISGGLPTRSEIRHTLSAEEKQRLIQMIESARWSSLIHRPGQSQVHDKAISDVLGSAEFSQWAIKLPRKNISPATFDYAKKRMGGLMAPFTILENVTVNGQKHDWVIVQNRMNVVRDASGLPDEYDFEGGGRFSGLWEQERELIVETVRRGIFLGDALIAKNYGISEPGKLLFVDEMDLQPGLFDDLFPHKTAGYPRIGRTAEEKAFDREFYKGWTPSHLDQIGLPSDLELSKLFNTETGDFPLEDVTLPENVRSEVRNQEEPKTLTPAQIEAFSELLKRWNVHYTEQYRIQRVPRGMAGHLMLQKRNPQLDYGVGGIAEIDFLRELADAFSSERSAPGGLPDFETALNQFESLGLMTEEETMSWLEDERALLKATRGYSVAQSEPDLRVEFLKKYYALTTRVLINTTLFFEKINYAIQGAGKSDDRPLENGFEQQERGGWHFSLQRGFVSGAERQLGLPEGVDGEAFFREHPARVFDAFYKSLELDLPLSVDLKKALELFQSEFADWVSAQRLSPEPSEEFQRLHQIFLNIMASEKTASAMLWWMHRLGYLEAYIPEMQKVNHLASNFEVQAFTVGQHTLYNLEMLDRMAVQDNQITYPNGYAILTKDFTAERWRVMRLALLLHDLGKRASVGATEPDHALVAARLIAPARLKEMGLSPREIALAAWTIRNHMRLNEFARRPALEFEWKLPILIRDMTQDPALDLEHLQMLYILSLTDRNSVDPLDPEFLNPQSTQQLTRIYEDLISYLKTEPADRLKYLSQLEALAHRDTAEGWQQFQNQMASQIKGLLERIDWSRYSGAIGRESLESEIQSALVSKIEQLRNDDGAFLGVFHQLLEGFALEDLREMSAAPGGAFKVLQRFLFLVHLNVLRDKGIHETVVLFSPGFSRMYERGYQVLVGAPFDEHGFFYRVTGGLLYHGFDVEEADVRTLSNGMIVDGFTGFFKGEFPDQSAHEVLQREMVKSFERVFAPQTPLSISDLFSQAGRLYVSEVSDEQSHVETEVRFIYDADIYGKHVSVLNLTTGNRLGLLHALALLFLKEGVDLVAAPASTHPAYSTDTFYVTRNGQPLTVEDKARMETQIQSLLAQPRIDFNSLLSRSEMRSEVRGSFFLHQGEMTKASFDTLRSTFEKKEVPARLRSRVLEALTKEADSYMGEERKALFQKRLEKIKGSDFKMYSIPPHHLGPDDYLEGLYDEEHNKLYVSSDYLTFLEGKGPVVEDYDRKLLREVMYPSRKVLVLGASGFLGKEILNQLQGVYPDVVGTSHTPRTTEAFVPLDVTRETDVLKLIEQEKPDVIVYAAGVADVQAAEKEKDRAELLNAGVPKMLAQHFRGQLIYLSTDYVFDGQKFPYEPTDAPAPLNFYGQTKARGEQAVLAHPQNTVIRFGMVFGGYEAAPRDFIQQLVMHMEGFKQGDAPLVLDNSQIRHPVWTADIAELVANAVNEKQRGVLQMNGDEGMTKFQFAQAVEKAYREALARDRRPALAEGPFWVPAAASKQDQASAARPQNAQMINATAPTPFSQALDSMVYRYEDLTLTHFYEALLAGDAKTFNKLAASLTRNGVRWVITGNPEKIATWQGEKPAVYGYDQRPQIHEVLKKDFAMTAASRIRIDRVIDAGVLNSPASELQILVAREIQRYRGEPTFELSALGKSHNTNVLTYLLLHGYSESMNAGLGMRKVWVPLKEDDGEEGSSQKLQGGSFSSVYRLTRPSGDTRIEKRAKTAEDNGKLLAEAQYMRRLQESGDPAGRWFPRILSIQEDAGETIVQMEDIPWPNLTDVVQQSFAESSYSWMQGSSHRNISKKTQMQVIQNIYRLLTPDFYSQVQSPTPPDFIERYHFKKVEDRWKQAAQKSEFVRELLEAPYLVFSDDQKPLMPNLQLMLNILRRIAQAHPEPFTPPYLSKQHGDLHEGNILLDPFTFVATGELQNIKLIDPKYMPEGNDPLYDFAKLMHNYFGHYDLALDHHQTFNFIIDLPTEANQPARFSNYFDDDASGTEMMLSRIGMFNKEVIEFLGSADSDRLFPFEKDPIAWRMRLLFTHATLVAGLLPFHTTGDHNEDKVGILYERTAHLFHMILDGFHAQGLMKDIPGLQKAWEALDKAHERNKRPAFEKALKQLEAVVRSEVRGDESPVADILRAQMRDQGGAITFHDFMQTSLYDPQHGYYTGGHVSLGGSDAFHDFSTYVEKYPNEFAEGLLNHMVVMWEKLGEPKKLQIVEMGAGQGVLASHILQTVKATLTAINTEDPRGRKYQKLRGFLKSLDYVIVEISDDLKRRQQTEIGRVLNQPVISEDRMSDQQVSVSWAPFAAHQITGAAVEGKKNPLTVSMPRIFISNELPDAFPVHRVRQRIGTQGFAELQEAYVQTNAAGQFEEVWKPIRATESLRMEMVVARMGKVAEKRLHQGGEIAVNLRALEWQGRLAELLNRSSKDRGYIITIDYGYPGKQYIPDNKMSVRGYAKGRPFILFGVKIRNPELLRRIHLAMGLVDQVIKLFPLRLMRLLYRLNPMNLFVPDDHYIYEKPGYTDITSDVDFSMLDDLGERIGLATEVITSQGHFFELSGLPRPKAVDLDHPGFFAMVQSKGIKQALFDGERASPPVWIQPKPETRRSEARLLPQQDGSALTFSSAKSEMRSEEGIQRAAQRIAANLNRMLNRRQPGDGTEIIKDVILIAHFLQENNPQKFSASDQYQFTNYFFSLNTAFEESKTRRDAYIREALEGINRILKREGWLLFYSSFPGSKDSPSFHLLDWKAARNQAAAIAKQLTLRGSGQLRSILVAEDRLIPEYEFWAKELQEKLGINVLVKPNGREGLEELKTRSGQYDLIISDVNMPEMSGPEMMNAFSELSRQKHDIPGIYVTDVNIEALQPQREAGRDYAYPPVLNWTNRAYLEKPAMNFDVYSLTVLSEVIEQLLARSEVRAGENAELIASKGQIPSGFNYQILEETKDKAFWQWFDAPEQAQDRALFDQIIRSGDAGLPALLKEHSGKIYVKEVVAKNGELVLDSEDGRTVYLKLGKPFGEIRELRLKGVRLRRGEDGAVKSYGYHGRGFVPVEVTVKGPGQLLFKKKPAGYKAFGGASLASTLNEQAVLEKTRAAGLQDAVDFPLGTGQYADALYRDQAMGFSVIGMRGTDRRFIVHLKPDDEDDEYGDKLSFFLSDYEKHYPLIPVNELSLLHSLGNILRQYHDAGFYHLYPHFGNFGLKEGADLSHITPADLVIRDMGSTIERAQLKPADTQEKTALAAMHRWLDVAKVLRYLRRSDDLLSNLSILEKAFLQGYFGDAEGERVHQKVASYAFYMYMDPYFLENGYLEGNNEAVFNFNQPSYGVYRELLQAVTAVEEASVKSKAKSEVRVDIKQKLQDKSVKGLIYNADFIRVERERAAARPTIAFDMDRTLGRSYGEDYEKFYDVRPGMEELLKNLKAAGARLVIWTSAGSDDVELFFKNHEQLLTLFDLVISKDDFSIYTDAEMLSRWKGAYQEAEQDRVQQYMKAYSVGQAYFLPKDIALLGYRALVDDTEIWVQAVKDSPFYESAGRPQGIQISRYDGTQDEEGEAAYVLGLKDQILPLLRSEVRTSDAGTPRAPSPSWKPRRVLIVEDGGDHTQDPAEKAELPNYYRNAVQKFWNLRAEDVSVVAAVEDAERLIREGAVFDFVLLDNDLEGDREGYELIETVRAKPEWAKTLILFNSANLQRRQVVRFTYEEETPDARILIAPAKIKMPAKKDILLGKSMRRWLTEVSSLGLRRAQSESPESGTLPLVDSVEAARAVLAGPLMKPIRESFEPLKDAFYRGVNGEEALEDVISKGLALPDRAGDGADWSDLMHALGKAMAMHDAPFDFSIVFEITGETAKKYDRKAVTWNWARSLESVPVSDVNRVWLLTADIGPAAQMQKTTRVAEIRLPGMKARSEVRSMEGVPDTSVSRTELWPVSYHPELQSGEALAKLASEKYIETLRESNEEAVLWAGDMAMQALGKMIEAQNLKGLDTIREPLMKFSARAADQTGTVQKLVERSFLESKKEAPDFDTLLGLWREFILLHERTEISIRIIRHEGGAYDFNSNFQNAGLSIARLRNDEISDAWDGFIKPVREIQSSVHERITQRKTQQGETYPKTAPILSFAEAAGWRQLLYDLKSFHEQDAYKKLIDVNRDKLGNYWYFAMYSVPMFLELIEGTPMLSESGLMDVLWRAMSGAAGDVLGVRAPYIDPELPVQERLALREGYLKSLLEQGVEFDVQIASEAKVYVEPLLFSQALRTLMKNSLQVASERLADENEARRLDPATAGQAPLSRKDRPVKFRIHYDGSTLDVIELVDNAGGIAEKDSEFLEETYSGSGRQKLMILNNSRRKNDTGFGLAFVWHVIHMHGGAFALENTQVDDASGPKKGLRVRIQIPKKEAEPSGDGQVGSEARSEVRTDSRDSVRPYAIQTGRLDSSRPRPEGEPRRPYFSPKNAEVRAGEAARDFATALKTGVVTRAEVMPAIRITLRIGAAPVAAELERIRTQLEARGLRGETILIAGRSVDAARVHAKVQSMLEQLTARMAGDFTEGHAVTYLMPADQAGAATLERVLERFAPDLKQVLFKKGAEQADTVDFLEQVRRLNIPVGFISGLKKPPVFLTDQNYSGLVGSETEVPREGVSDIFVPVVQVENDRADSDPLIRELELAMQTAIALLVAAKIKKISDRSSVYAQAVALLKDYELFPGFESSVILSREGGVAISGAAIESFLADWAARQQIQAAA